MRTFIGTKKCEIWVISAKSRNAGAIVSVKIGRDGQKLFKIGHRLSFVDESSKDRELAIVF